MLLLKVVIELSIFATASSAILEVSTPRMIRFGYHASFVEEMAFESIINL